MQERMEIDAPKVYFTVQEVSRKALGNRTYSETFKAKTDFHEDEAIAAYRLLKKRKANKIWRHEVHFYADIPYAENLWEAGEIVYEYSTGETYLKFPSGATYLVNSER